MIITVLQDGPVILYIVHIFILNFSSLHFLGATFLEYKSLQIDLVKFPDVTGVVIEKLYFFAALMQTLGPVGPVICGG